MRARLAVFGLVACLYGLSAFAQDVPPPKAFVGTFSNGVTVELIGVGMNPSANADWWKPDGSPLEERPYAQVRARVGGETTREFCWRWRNLGDADVETGWQTEPHYVGAGGYAADNTGKKIERLQASAVAFDSAHKECTVRFTITVPASPWVTTIETQAGYASSMGKMDAAIGAVGVAFLPSRNDGPDTVVTLAYEIPEREVRLVGVDNERREHIAERTTSSGISGMLLGEYRFKNVIRTELKKWRLQTRVRKSEIIWFHNVSLEPGHETEVEVLDADTKTLNFVETKPTPPVTPVAVSDLTNPAEQHYRRQQELVKALAEKHGYRLDEDEPLKYIKDPSINERDRFHASFASSLSLGEWMSQSDESEPKFEPCMLLFQYREGTLDWKSSHEGITTLAEVVANVLNLRRHEIDCPENLYLTYMPGDWVLSWDPNQPHELSDAEVKAFEQVLNEEFDLAVQVAWKTVERPALVLRGEYRAAPKNPDRVSGRVAERADGMFEIPTRRTNIAHSVGTYQRFKQAIGEALMLPVVDEGKVRPAKEDFFWEQTGTPITNTYRLPATDEQRVLDSLHEQLGYDLSIEPRKVRLLSIEPVAE